MHYPRPTHTTSHSFAGLPSATFRDFDEDDLATPTQSTWHRRSRTAIEIPINVPLTRRSPLPSHLLLSYVHWLDELTTKLQADIRAEEAEIADLKAYRNMMDSEQEDCVQWRILLMRMLPGAKNLDEATRTYEEILDKKYDIVVKTTARVAHCRMRAYEAREQLEKAVIAARQELKSLQVADLKVDATVPGTSRVPQSGRLRE
ncbi:hypothetical protein PENSPDRAFT_657120 [Peniophora sp. CONT]|nr:hypothetical protein PENSPDRAFT_657120 [Peniophora sp. CONT]